MAPAIESCPLLAPVDRHPGCSAPGPHLSQDPDLGAAEENCCGGACTRRAHRLPVMGPSPAQRRLARSDFGLRIRSLDLQPRRSLMPDLDEVVAVPDRLGGIGGGAELLPIGGYPAGAEREAKHLGGPPRRSEGLVRNAAGFVVDMTDDLGGTDQVVFSGRREYFRHLADGLEVIKDHRRMHDLEPLRAHSLRPVDFVEDSAVLQRVVGAHDRDPPRDLGSPGALRESRIPRPGPL